MNKNTMIDNLNAYILGGFMADELGLTSEDIDTLNYEMQGINIDELNDEEYDELIEKIAEQLTK